MGEILADRISHKGLVFKTHKELSETKQEEKKTPVNKEAKVWNG